MAGHGMDEEERLIGGLLSLLAVIAVMAVVVGLVLPWLEARRRLLAVVVRPRVREGARPLGRGLTGLS